MEVDRLLTSAFLRTMETTDAIRRATGLVPQVWPELHEQGGCVSGPQDGDYSGQPGMSDSEIRQRFPGFKVGSDIDQRGWWRSEPFEPVDEAKLRSERILDRIRQDLVPNWRRVAVVTHGTIGRLLINTMFESRFVDQAWEQDLFNTSVTTVTVTRRSVRLLAFNTVGHLPKRLHTK